MDNVKNDNYYIQKIRQDLEFIVIHMKDVDIEECFLQALFGQNCKIFLDIVAKRFWTLLHVQIGQSCNAPAGCVINQP